DALVLCLVGYWSGRLRFTLRHSAVLALAAAVAMAAVGEALSAGLTLALDSPEVTWTMITRVLPSTLLYDVALGPLILLSTVLVAAALGGSIGPVADSPAPQAGRTPPPPPTPAAPTPARP